MIAGAKENGAEPRDGAQSIHRAILLLRAVAASPRGGASLTALAAASGLSTSTVHRTLAVLTAEGMLDKDGKTRRYRPGPLLRELGLVAAAGNGLRVLARPMLQRLAAATGDTAYLNIRNGVDALCVECCEGTSPVRAVPMAVGNRRPLGLGAASIAVLAGLPAAEVAPTLASNGQRLQRAGLTSGGIMDALRDLRRVGYVVTTGRLGASYRGVAVPVIDPAGRFALGLSISGTEQSMGPARQAELGALLQAEARTFSGLLGARLSP